MPLVNGNKILQPASDPKAEPELDSSSSASLSFAPLKVKLPIYRTPLSLSLALPLPTLLFVSVWQKLLSELRNVCHDLWFLHPSIVAGHPMLYVWYLPSHRIPCSHNFRYLFAALPLLSSDTLIIDTGVTRARLCLWFIAVNGRDGKR